jgi:hypothetical protein
LSLKVEREIASRVAPQLERYSETLRQWREPDERTKAILSAFGPQLGEIAFHSIVFDDRIERMSNDDAAAILEVAKLLPPQNRPLRILEIGVHAHFSVHQAATKLGGGAIAVSHDISANALRMGKQLAQKETIWPKPSPLPETFMICRSTTTPSILFSAIRASTIPGVPGLFCRNSFVSAGPAELFACKTNP